MSEVREALTAANAGALIPKVISPSLLELVRRYSPLVRTIPTEHWTTSTYYFNNRSALPSAGFVTDGGAVPVANSTYNQASFPIKLLQGVGAVTGFAQAVTSGQIGSLLQKEMDGMRQGLLWDIETTMEWGNAAATASGQAPQFDGFDSLVNTFSGTSQNSVFYSGSPALALSNFDHLIDMVEENAATPTTSGGWIFVTSPSAESKLSSLLVSQQRFTSVDVAPGLNVSSYRDIPIIKSSFLAARSQQMGTVTPGTATTGGTLAAGTWRYQVSAIFARYGETLASTEVSQVTTGSTSTVTLTFSTPSGPDGGGVQLYKVYRTLVGGAAGTETLIGVCDAKDTGGTATTVITDTGTNLLTNSSGVTGPAAYVGASGASPLLTGMENAYLIPINPDFLVRPYVRDLEAIPLSPTTTGPDQLPFAMVSDTTLAVRSSKYMARISGFVVSTSTW